VGNAQLPVPEVDCVAATARPAALPEAQRLSKGPAFGSLVVAGGSVTQESEIFRRTLALAGGAANAKIVYVPTNGGGTFETPEQIQQALDSFNTLTGWTSLPNAVEFLHTYDPKIADEPSFFRKLDEATGVWFAGGLPYRTYDAYFGTGTQAALERLLQRGGVIAGTSAGALMQSNVMLRGCRSCARGNAQLIGDPWTGFGFGQMKNLMFDVHYMHRRRSFDIVEAFTPFPDALGVAIDEDTALVFKGGTDVFEVITGGDGWAAVYDPTLWTAANDQPFCADFRFSTGTGRVLLPNRGTFFMLESGSSYNVHTREVVRSVESSSNHTTEADTTCEYA
jgi:cyanophycinase